jgi:CBS domain-containing protein
MRTYCVADWMSTPPIMVAPTLSLSAAQRLMEQREVRRLPVVRDDRIVGIVTWGDLRAAQPSAATTLSVYEWRALLDQVPVDQCMTRDPVTITPGAPILEAAQLMLAHRIGGLPVLADGRVVGVITESDLFRLLIADATGAEHTDPLRISVVCHHCGAVLRGRSFDTIGPNDECWRCHYHLHRCESCRYFDGLVCLLDQAERQAPIPGQHCPMFAYLAPRATSVST